VHQRGQIEPTTAVSRLGLFHYSVFGLFLGGGFWSSFFATSLLIEVLFFSGNNFVEVNKAATVINNLTLEFSKSCTNDVLLLKVTRA
jgi:hypothetical protein